MSYNGENIKQPNVGWFFSRKYITENDAYLFDKQIATICANYGKIGFSFITYPIGGIYRYNCQINKNRNARPIHLPDLQMGIQFWQKYVNCALSSWIDPDSPDKWIADFSAQEFKKEMDYARYLGINNVLIELKHSESPKLAKLINNFLDSFNCELSFWILLPTNSTLFINEDCWLVWRKFRTLCNNCKNLFVGLAFTEDLGDEFASYKQIQRWRAEPLSFIRIDYSLFVRGNGSELKLTDVHSKLLKNLFFNNQCQHLLLSSLNYDELNELVFEEMLNGSLDCIKENNCKRVIEEEFLDEYMDIPLQPLSNSLDSSVYNTFEQDKPKYLQYQKAIKTALEDLLLQNLENIILIVLGAGRGPLVNASLSAIAETRKTFKYQKEFSVKIYAVEKNPNAIISLQYCNEERWKNSVSIIQSDMRSLTLFLESKEIENPDIIISELLGSFGDNELCPECLDGVNNILKENTICIPSSYRNFLTPIQSLRLYQNIRDLKNNNNCNRVNEMQLMGFAAHFEVVLYKNIILSTHPERHTENLFSWFPGLFPLRKLFYCPNECNIVFNIKRKFDKEKVWYEWFIEYEENGELIKSELQNENGESQSMNLS
uniref:Protein arginine N-methyltransferase n=2 Tax=Meloidogyne TaxID=189290 RepID=A0A915NC69_9BILA